MGGGQCGQTQDLGSPHTRAASVLESTELKVFRDKAVVCKQMEEGMPASQKESTGQAGRAGPGD